MVVNARIKISDIANEDIWSILGRLDTGGHKTSPIYGIIEYAPVGARTDESIGKDRLVLDGNPRELNCRSHFDDQSQIIGVPKWINLGCPAKSSVPHRTERIDVIRRVSRQLSIEVGMERFKSSLDEIRFILERVSLN